MKEITNIEDIKSIALDLLCAVDEFCTQNKIMYSLACGTLIGAIRHKGFIPWDDDVDIYMKRNDYERFVQIFPKVFKEHISLISLERSDNWNSPFAKVYDLKTIVYEGVKYNVHGMGIGIDVFPIDNAPDDDHIWQKYEKKRKLLRDIYMLKSLRWRKERSLGKNLMVNFSSLILSPISYRRLALMLDKYSKRFNKIETNYYAENCMGIPNNRFPKDDFSSTIPHPFEDFSLQVMQGYDDYLRRFYGDYMQLPREEDQVTHHDFKAYWKE